MAWRPLASYGGIGVARHQRSIGVNKAMASAGSISGMK